MMTNTIKYKGVIYVEGKQPTGKGSTEKLTPEEDKANVLEMLSYHSSNDFGNLQRTVSQELAGIRGDYTDAAEYLDLGLRKDLARFIRDLDTLESFMKSLPKSFKPLEKRIKKVYQEADAAADKAIKNLPQKSKID